MISLLFKSWVSELKMNVVNMEKNCDESANQNNSPLPEILLHSQILGRGWVRGRDNCGAKDLKLTILDCANLAIRIRGLYILFILLFASITLQAQKSFSREQVLDDLTFLKASLEDAHYNLYAHTPKEEFDRNYFEVRESISQDSLRRLEAVSIIQRVMSKANNGHTGIDFPGQSYGEYVYAGGTILPIEIAFEYGKSLVRKNWSTNDKIKIGSEVLSINGIQMTEILEKIYPQVSAERMYFKLAKIEAFSFPRHYWQVFGSQETFEVQTLSNGIKQTYSIKAINTLEDYEMKREEVLNAKMKLSFFERAAYLNPGSFGGDEEKYRQFIDSAFLAIKAQKSQNLILDFRNNSGGDDSFSDYLVAYIADKPFKWHDRYTLKTSKFLKAHTRENYDTTKAFWQKVLTHKDGEIYEYEYDTYQPQPKQKRFSGKVYVLINRQSHSQSAVAAAQIQDYGFGTIVGEETGDSPSLYASIFKYPLPNTGILVQVSKGYIVRVNGSTKEEGVIPDIFIKDHLLDEEDEILEGLLAKINGT